jgi:Tfp pilus assembly protein PilO
MNRLIPIISILLLIILAVGAYIFLLPEYQKFSLLDSQLQAKESDLAQKKQDIIDMTADLNKVYSEYKDEAVAVNSVLPENISAPSLFNYMLKSSSENGLILEDVGWPRISPSEDVQKAVFPITMTGSYGAFKNFLSATYKSGRLIEVESISLSPVGKKNEDLFRFLLSLSVYGYSGETQPTVVGQ